MREQLQIVFGTALSVFVSLTNLPSVKLWGATNVDPSPPRPLVVAPGASPDGGPQITPTGQTTPVVPKPFKLTNFQFNIGDLPTKSIPKVDAVVPKVSQPNNAQGKPPSLILDDNIQFGSVSGTGVTVPRGNYRVTGAANELRLVSANTAQQPAFRLASQPTTYQGTIPAPGALWLPSEDARYQLLLLLGPGGQALYSIGRILADSAHTVVRAPSLFYFPDGGANSPGIIPANPVRVVRCDPRDGPVAKPPNQQDAGKTRESECRDMNPGALYVLLTNFLGKNLQALVEDRRATHDSNQTAPIPAPKVAPLPQTGKTVGVAPGSSRTQTGISIAPQGGKTTSGK